MLFDQLHGAIIQSLQFTTRKGLRNDDKDTVLRDFIAQLLLGDQ